MSKFSNFNRLIKKRQNKIIVSVASYPERFLYLPDLMKFIKNQTFPINNINFFFYKGHKKDYNIHLNDVKIHFEEKNLKPHLKYFYAMKLYREFAIITLDDDLGFARDTFESLIKAYIENPNIINGRRAHLITYKNNGELKGYYKWVYEQREINESSFNLSLTNGAGTIFPPDILNINDDYLPIINETITCDDLTLKYFSIIKGIPHKWIVNNHVMGIPRILPKSKSSHLYEVNAINNDLCINKLNMMINRINLNDLCVPYKNLSTGIAIYLFDLHNQKTINNTLYFDIYAYSYCPIDTKFKFGIYFDNFTANCFINNSKIFFSFDSKIINKRIASCHIDLIDNNNNNNNNNLDDFLFPKAISSDNLIINIKNYRSYLTAIFKDFLCEEINNCVLKVLIYEKFHLNKFTINIENKNYECQIDENCSSTKEIFPVIKDFRCALLNYFYNNTKTVISGLPLNLNIMNKKFIGDNIPKQFIITRIVEDKDNLNKKVIIIGNLVDDLKKNLYNFKIHFIHPNMTLKCTMKPYSKYVQSKIYCINNMTFISSRILIENQIVRSLNNEEELILINEETLIKINFSRNQEYHDDNIEIEPHKLKYVGKIFFLKIIICILLIILIFKIVKVSKKTCFRINI